MVRIDVLSHLTVITCDLQAGMERKDVMGKNVAIYKSQAAALEKNASKDCKVGGWVGGRGKEVECLPRTARWVQRLCAFLPRLQTEGLLHADGCCVGAEGPLRPRLLLFLTARVSGIM